MGGSVAGQRTLTAASFRALAILLLCSTAGRASYRHGRTRWQCAATQFDGASRALLAQCIAQLLEPSRRRGITLSDSGLHARLSGEQT
jgi:hypothetical protein